MSKMESKAECVNRSVGAIKFPAALFKRISIWPNSFTAASFIASTSSQFLTSHCTHKTFPPVSSSSSFAVFCNFSKFREVMTTLAPNCKKYLVMAFPNPLPPPVTTATLSFNASSLSIGCVYKFIFYCFCKFKRNSGRKVTKSYALDKDEE